MKKTVSVLLVCLMLFSFSAQALDISADGACTIDFESGEILFEKNSDKMMTPASLTKIMTLYIVFEKIEKGELSFDTLIPISQNAAKLSCEKGTTNIPLCAGECLPLSSLIDAMAIVSACASCTAVAEFICTSEEEFSLLMNEKAKEMGLWAYFEDASGLSDANLITPKSAAKLVCSFIKEYPQILEFTKKTEVIIKGKKYLATNLLLPGGKFFFEGADGFKTGTTTLAGKCLAATANKGETRIISVSMKSDTNDLRYKDAQKLLESAFQRTEYLNTNLFETDIKTFIDGQEIPCTYALGRKKALCIMAENLNFYGFDTYYDKEKSTLYIYENNKKKKEPLLCEKKTAGDALYKIYTEHTPKVIFVKDGKSIFLETVFSLNGQCAISFDEFGKNFFFEWDEDARTAKIVTER